MYNFIRYDPLTPRMVTSFKGNQKLIFEGYRYNIHHIVPAKNVKTWRCVCAKKLTSQRSWCKGRAETWDNDSHGTSKGEHNHAAEHDVAELEYFKSQLILAAIDFPDAPLNDLIDAASSMMTVGVNFGSRDSLKKSLTVARKSAENGGFKLKNYKNSADSSARSRAGTTPATPRVPANRARVLANCENGTMASLLALANQCRETNNNNDLEDTRSTPSMEEYHQSTSSASLASFIGHDADDDGLHPPAAKAAKFDQFSFQDSTQRTAILDLFTSVMNSSAAASAAAQMLTSTPVTNNNVDASLNSSGYQSMAGLCSKEWQSSLIVDRSGASPVVGGTANSSERSTPQSFLAAQNQNPNQNAHDHSILPGSTPTPRRKPTEVNKGRRVNSMIDRLAAMASGGTTSPLIKQTNGNTSVSSASAPAVAGFASTSTSSPKPTTASIAVQTDAPLENGSTIHIGSCLSSMSTCKCRVVRVCCCSNDTCHRGVKRSHATANGSSVDDDEELEEIIDDEDDSQAPPAPTPITLDDENSCSEVVAAAALE